MFEWRSFNTNYANLDIKIILRRTRDVPATVINHIGEIRQNNVHQFICFNDFFLDLQYRSWSDFSFESRLMFLLDGKVFSFIISPSIYKRLFPDSDTIVFFDICWQSVLHHHATIPYHADHLTWSSVHCHFWMNGCKKLKNIMLVMETHGN